MQSQTNPVEGEKVVAEFSFRLESGRSVGFERGEGRVRVGFLGGFGDLCGSCCFCWFLFE